MLILLSWLSPNVMEIWAGEIPSNHSNLLKMIRFPESFSESLFFFSRYVVNPTVLQVMPGRWEYVQDPSEIERVLGGDGIAVIRA